MLRSSSLALVAALALLPAAATGSAAQAYPTKPIRFVVPNPPGGANDLLARELGQELQKRLGQPVVVDNRPGAGGNIGADAVAKATPDGHTILMAANTFVINPHLVKQMPFDVAKDFAPVTLAVSVPFAMVTNPKVPAKTVAEFITYAKQQGGKVNYASSGAGTPQHLGAELFKTLTKVEMEHVPFKGAAQTVPELLAGRVEVLFGAINSLMPHIKAEKLNALAITRAKRTPALPNVPTMIEAGVPGYDIDVWLGVLAPAATPQPIVAKLNAEIVEIMKSKDFQDRMAVHGLEVIGSTPDEFAAVMKADLVKWGEAVKQAGIQPE